MPLKFQPPIPPVPSGTSLHGKTALITGGNSGIGLETARQMLTLGASRVIITARDASKGEQAVRSLRQDLGITQSNPDAKIEVFALDVDDYKSGMDFCDQVKKEVPRLDILVCNAGVFLMKYERSSSGHERVMQVNCYTHFLIILELLPLLQTTAATNGQPSRITFNGSSTQYQSSISAKSIPSSGNLIKYFDDAKTYSGLRRYSDSKLVVNAFVHYISTIVPPSEVIINNVCPGLVAATSLDKDIAWWLKPIMTVFRALAARTVEEGSRCLIHASCIWGPESHGKFMHNNKVDPGAPFLQEDSGVDFTKRLGADLLSDFKSVDPLLEKKFAT
ncbi:hypothetical protein UA08_06320 [Talaromyces atroroseus]|uniref:Uncharacterized protein n=1 Tax=Talaromyces atroroseus TaxID=1441469 RepID=A0A225AWC1_TALAT|nr:hypothetical protein UA08_06320 [Talaromyces atroroseus]OKL58735.1 hypothetical protein UA08_06320 [Talaromyces atroroseus]